jgi:hypothetical protein
MNRYSQDYRAHAAMKIAASLAAVRHQHQIGPAYTHEQVVSGAIAIATLLTAAIIELEKKDNPLIEVEMPDPELPKPLPVEPPPPVVETPPPAPPPPATTPTGEAPKVNVEPPAANPKAPADETITSPQSPHARSKHPSSSK